MPARPRIHHTAKEKLHLRRQKRKNGPSAKRRAERRAHLQIKVSIAIEDKLSPALAIASDAFSRVMNPACELSEAEQREIINRGIDELRDEPGEHQEVIDAINEVHGITEGDPA